MDPKIRKIHLGTFTINNLAGLEMSRKLNRLRESDMKRLRNAPRGSTHPLARIFNAHGCEEWLICWLETEDIAWRYVDLYGEEDSKEYGPFSLSGIFAIPYRIGCALEVDRYFKG